MFLTIYENFDERQTVRIPYSDDHTLRVNLYKAALREAGVPVGRIKKAAADSLGALKLLAGNDKLVTEQHNLDGWTFGKPNEGEYWANMSMSEIGPARERWELSTLAEHTYSFCRPQSETTTFGTFHIVLEQFVEVVVETKDKGTPYEDYTRGMHNVRY
jgi:hypothetical protein